MCRSNEREPMTDADMEAVVEAIREGRVDDLRNLLAEAPGLLTRGVRSEARPDEVRTLLHVATDWPGHFPNAVQTVALLVELGVDVDAPFRGGHAETPLHWAASCNDVEVVERLLDFGANIDAAGGVIADGTPLADAVAFGQWEAARRLVGRGARVEPGQAAALGDLEGVRDACSRGIDPTAVSRLFWMACHGGQRQVAEYLLDEEGADLNWLPPWEAMTPLDAADRSGFGEVTEWLRGRGARSAAAVS